MKGYNDMGIGKLEIRNLCKSFEGTQALGQVSFEVVDGEFAAVMGQSGCGKSTLLYCVSGMDRPTSGEVRFDGRELSTLTDREMEKLRLEHMGFIFQKANFLKNLSIADNIVFPAFQLGRQSRSEIVREADRVIYLEDGQVKDILKLGKYRETDRSGREQNMQEWLREMGF